MDQSLVVTERYPRLSCLLCYCEKISSSELLAFVFAERYPRVKCRVVTIGATLILEEVLNIHFSIYH